MFNGDIRFLGITFEKRGEKRLALGHVAGVAAALSSRARTRSRRAACASSPSCPSRVPDAKS